MRRRELHGKLTHKVTEKEQIEATLELPYFPPNLKVWQTPLNSKYLVTGSIRADAALVEKQYNYLRLNLLVKTSETDTDLLRKIEEKQVSTVIEKV